MKRLVIYVFILLTLALLAGCGTSKPAGPAASSPAPSPEETVYAPIPLAYTWQPHVYADFYRTHYDLHTEQTFYAMIDAVLAYEEGFSCPSEEVMYQLSGLSHSCFPPYHKLVSGIRFEGGQALLTYAFDEETHSTILEQFKTSVADFITASVMEGDDDTTKAIALYMDFSMSVTYDYAAAENDTVSDVSSFRALTDHEGICQSFASGYAYLCLQAGVEAIPTSGMPLC